MKLIRFYDIDWDIDTDNSDNDCPTEIIFEFDFSDDESVEEIVMDINEYGADYLSDEKGFLVNGFSFEIL